MSCASPWGFDLKKIVLWFCIALAAFVALVPLMRAGLHLEVSYNEGWNVYNAARVAEGIPLYPERVGWTGVNYPMLSFAVLAGLHKVTGDYLFTARAVSFLSLLASAVLVGAIVRGMGAKRSAALFAGLFCWTLFCVEADTYVGMDDPQLMAQAVFLLALWVYVRRPRRRAAVLASALLFVTAMCLKHNPVDIPVAVFLDLSLSSLALAGWFAGGSLAFAGVAVWLHLHFGGPFVAAQILSPRRYLAARVPEQIFNVLGPVLVPLVLGAWAGWSQRKLPQRRLALLLLGAALLIGSYFSGGIGVTINAMFTSLLALSLLLGLFLDEPTLGGKLRWHPGLRPVLPLLCIGWLLIPFALTGNWKPWSRWHELQQQQIDFGRDVAFLKAHPGPALCESLLECFEAGKPYQYDPFNATRLLSFHLLDARQVTDGLREARYSAVQTDSPLERNYSVQQERFDPAIRQAILDSYQRVLRPGQGDAFAGEAGANSTLYVPHTGQPREERP